MTSIWLQTSIQNETSILKTDQKVIRYVFQVSLAEDFETLELFVSSKLWFQNKTCIIVDWFEWLKILELILLN